MYLLQDFSQIVSTLRRERGLTQERFAAMLGLTAQAVSKWETGAGLPDAAMFPDIARVLNVPVGYLFGEAEGTQAASDFCPAPEHDGLPLCHVQLRQCCYSNKTVEHAQGWHVSFTDGSSADLKTGVVTNLGSGEIRICEAQTSASPDEVSLPEQVFPAARHLHLDLYCPVHVVITPSQGESRISASGSASFIAALQPSFKADTLTIRCHAEDTSHCRNTLHIQLAGEGCLLIDACREIDGELTASGSGVIELGHILETSREKLSSDVTLTVKKRGK